MRCLIAAVAVAIGLSGCGNRIPRVVLDRGIVPCAAGAEKDFLTADALQCWMDAPNGRWRLVDLGFHQDALVLDIVATSLDDAEEVARRAAANHSRDYTEILVYARPEPSTAETMVRRVRWVRGSDRLDTLDFPGP